MPKRVRTGLTRSDILDRYVERFKQQLVKFQPFLSRKRGAASLDDFDEAAEELIGQVFGAASDESEAYFFAKTGESALLPEEAQESGTHDIERESLHQRRQVLESCLADLELRRRLQATRQGKGLDQALVKETLFVFVRVWLEHNPPIDEALEDSAAASAEARFERFLQMVANALRGGRSISGGSVPNSEDATSAGGDFGATAP